MMKKQRPYAQLGVSELENLVQDSPERRATNEAILGELKHRNTTRAHLLMKRIEALLQNASPAADMTSPRAPEKKPAAPQPAPSSTAAPAIPLPTRSTVDNDPQDILRAWTVMEVLSPATFKRPLDLAGGKMENIARFDRGLPWSDGPAKGPPGHRLYFQIVLGSILMPPAIDALLQRFADTRPEKPQIRGENPLAVIIVDREGRPIDEACATISSFGWGLPQALSGHPTSLSRWPEEEERIQKQLHERLYREGKDGKPLALNGPAISDAYQWLVNQLGLSEAIMKAPSFAVRNLVPFRSSSPPEALLLNSFFLKDLARASKLVADDKAPDMLKRFLGALQPEARRELLNDAVAIEETVSPGRFPLGRWPGSGRHPLVLMQQAAVNLAAAQKPGEMLAVNGPPGTGKTTLLRDVVAALVTERAQVMAGFDDPETAFRSSGAKLNLGGAWIHLYHLDPRLRGFEMIVASSNNKAVENVSKELPAINQIADDATGLRYFKPMADALLGQESWGAIAAVLGNSGNRNAFRNRFWWADDTGLFSYFKAIDGRNPEIDLPDGRKRPPRIVSELQPPLDRREALRRWREARTRFVQLREKVSLTRDRAEEFRRRIQHLPALGKAVEAVRNHATSRPGLIQRLLRLAGYRAWKHDHLPLSSDLAMAARDASGANVIPASLHACLHRSPWLGFGAESRQATIDKILQPLLAQLAEDRRRRGGTAIDDTFFELGRHHVQPSSPWLTAEEHRDRDTLFEAALDLHRAFIDVAAKPLRQNIAASLQVIDGKGLGDPARDALIPELWSSLFLVVPVLSTTFASVGTMLGKLPPASLGWLLVDEAGQAAPQQAVGAITRVGRAIIVGDPIQVPPVVMLPDRLTTAICKSFGVDAGRFAAPAASVQTLADDATAWFAEFPAQAGSRNVGVPLLVHRRCSEPMFGIANKVAYENLMVHAKRPGTSVIRDLIGPARWFDVKGSGSDKWCPAEGELAVQLIESIVAAGLEPDLYVVTPFVQVADGLRELIRKSPVLAAAPGIPDLGKWAFERVGTVHTVQGREAEAVIFVLGAPNADQTGARGWAGKEPNLLNVAVTRAKEVVYVIGNRDHWLGAGVFKVLGTLAVAAGA